MPIRYKCDTCGSKLNIKDELAGTAGKCPKCKTAFTVPQPAAADADDSVSETRQVASVADATVTKPPTKAARSASRKAQRSADDDFDPMAVLMGDEPPQGTAKNPGSANKKPAPPPLSDDEVPADLDFELEIGGDDDEEDDVPVAKKPKKRKRVQFDSDDDFDASTPNSASATASAMLTGGASAGAKDLLTRTMEESRARASRVDDDTVESDGNATLQDLLHEFGPKAAAIAAGLLLLVFGLYRISDSMMGGGMVLPDLGRVYGTVTLDGAPLAGAKVQFVPSDRTESIDKNGKHRLRTATARTDEDGYYDLYYNEDVRGAAVTEHRVVIKKIGSNGRPVTPSQYADYSMEMRNVESGSNEFNFDLHSDAAAAPPAAGQ